MLSFQPRPHPSKILTTGLYIKEGLIYPPC
jgi:hypothetical protein